MAHAIHEQHATSPAAPPAGSSAHHGDHERLFRLLEELGPAPDDFMLGLSDPLLTRENIFEDSEDEDQP